MSNYKEIGSRLRAIRQRDRVPVSQLAESLGVSEPTYYRYETAVLEISMPDLQKVARVFGVSICELLGEEPPGGPLGALAREVSGLPPAAQLHIGRVLRLTVERERKLSEESTYIAPSTFRRVSERQENYEPDVPPIMFPQGRDVFASHYGIDLSRLTREEWENIEAVFQYEKQRRELEGEDSS